MDRLTEPIDSISIRSRAEPNSVFLDSVNSESGNSEKRPWRLSTCYKQAVSLELRLLGPVESHNFACRCPFLLGITPAGARASVGIAPAHARRCRTVSPAQARGKLGVFHRSAEIITPAHARCRRPRRLVVSLGASCRGTARITPAHARFQSIFLKQSFNYACSCPSLPRISAVFLK